jgi:hypothetical protein
LIITENSTDRNPFSIFGYSQQGGIDPCVRIGDVSTRRCVMVVVGNSRFVPSCIWGVGGVVLAGLSANACIGSLSLEDIAWEHGGIHKQMRKT